MSEWPFKVSENEMRNFVEKDNAMRNALKVMEEFVTTGKLPIVEGKEKTVKDMLAALDNWDTYCAEEFVEGSDRKKDMQGKLAQLRKDIEARVAENS